MPLYEYRCQACGRQFEAIRKFSDPELDVCALCGKGPIERLVSSPAIQFKGSGWYITDYAQKGKSGSDSSATMPSGESKTTTPATSTSSDSESSAPASKPPTKSD